MHQLKTIENPGKDLHKPTSAANNKFKIYVQE